jgi:hypothetical protein
VRVAVSGSHGTGKSTLIAAFLARRPEYAHEPEAFETLGDDVDLSASGGPTADGLHRLIGFTAQALAAHPPASDVVHERSPVDYLAYAAASRRAWPKGEAEQFLESHAPLVRACLRDLDLIVLVPVSAAIEGRAGDRYRKRVDEHLRRMLIDDDLDLFRDDGSPRVVELPPDPDRRLAELLLLTS